MDTMSYQPISLEAYAAAGRIANAPEAARAIDLFMNGYLANDRTFGLMVQKMAHTPAGIASVWKLAGLEYEAARLDGMDDEDIAEELIVMAASAVLGITETNPEPGPVLLVVDKAPSFKFLVDCAKLALEGVELPSEEALPSDELVEACMLMHNYKIRTAPPGN